MSTTSVRCRPTSRAVTTERMIGMDGPSTLNDLQLYEEDGATLLTLLIEYPDRETRDMILATGMTVLGLEQLLGRVGIGVAAIVVVFLGNPLSGLAAAPELLPQPWGAIGQLLPPGATGTLLRNIAFFDGAAIGRPVLVLIGWVLMGVALLVLAGVRTGRAARGA